MSSLPIQCSQFGLARAHCSCTCSSAQRQRQRGAAKCKFNNALQVSLSPPQAKQQASTGREGQRERRGGRQKFQVFWSHLCAFEYFGLVSHPHTHSLNLVRSSGRVQIAAQALITPKCPRILNYGSPLPPTPLPPRISFSQLFSFPVSIQFQL